MKTVLYVNYYASPVTMRFLDGVFRYAHKAKWNVQTVYKAHESSLGSLIEFWNPVGCIYGANDGIKPKLLKLCSGRPLVLMDCDESFSWPGAGKVCDDSDEVTGVVVREFLSMGLKNFAFCGYKGIYQWTDRRERCFRRLLALNGRKCDETIWIDPDDAKENSLRIALKRLKRPCGLYAANDDIGRRVLGACRMARIPDPERGGWKRFVLRPYPDRRLGSCSATYRSDFGTILSAWRYGDDGSLTWRFSIPKGSTALVTAPDGIAREYQDGDYELKY